MLQRWLTARRRSRQARSCPPGPLAAFYQTPAPAPRSPLSQVQVLAVDLETTGFEPARDQILSIGWVPIRDRRVCLSGARCLGVRPQGPLPAASVVVHGITDDRAAAGLELEAALAELLQALAGGVMLAHNARAEQGFLEAACQQLWGTGFVVPTIDTFALELRRRQRGGRPVRPGQMRLARLRQAYGLPRYRVHGALIDAVAAAELFLAQLAHTQGRRDPTLAELT